MTAKTRNSKMLSNAIDAVGQYQFPSELRIETAIQNEELNRN
jgi:hypothetical protein